MYMYSECVECTSSVKQNFVAFLQFSPNHSMAMNTLCKVENKVAYEGYLFIDVTQVVSKQSSFTLRLNLMTIHSLMTSSLHPR